MKKIKLQKGFSLVALIITILILLILAVVSIRAVQGDGIIQYAKKSRNEHKLAQKNEIETLNSYLSKIDNAKIEYISSVESYIGYYANLDNDPEPEGIIYADLAFSLNGQWGNADGSFSYNAISGYKDYYVSLKQYSEGPFETQDVLTIAPETTGEDRFYIMALENFVTDDYSSFFGIARHLIKR